MKKPIVGLLLILICGYAKAQTSTCAQTLRLARSTYEQGRFHEIPALLEGCLKHGEGNFTKQESIEALRILTLAYLYQEEPEEADNTMLQLLGTDHFFEINENVDPAEFTALYKTFRTEPLFSIGFKFGTNATYPTPTSNFFVGSASANNGEYSPGFSIQFGLSFEKLLFSGMPDSKWTAAPEIMASNHAYAYANEVLTISDQDGLSYSNIESRFNQSRLDLNLLMQYKLLNSKINPYATFGPGISYLLKNNAQIETKFPKEGSAVSGPTIILKETFKSLDYTLIAGAGLKVKLGDIYVTIDARYKYGLTNLIKKSARSNPEATFDYGYVSNDLKQSSAVVNIGFIWPYFNPKKLVK